MAQVAQHKVESHGYRVALKINIRLSRKDRVITGPEMERVVAQIGMPVLKADIDAVSRCPGDASARRPTDQGIAALGYVRFGKWTLNEA